MSAKGVRELAQVVADESIETLDLLYVVESAEEHEFDLTEDELVQAYKLAIKAKAVLPNE